MKTKNFFYFSLLLVISHFTLTESCYAQFCYAKNIATDSVNYSIVAADFNKDGFDDLATVAMDTLVSLHLGDGTGKFLTPTTFNIGAMAMGMSVIAQDFNNDTKLDLAIADMMNMNVSVLLGNGNGTFGTATSFSVNPTPYMLVSADFNNDGKYDIATANNYSSKNVSVLLGNGNGTFSGSVPLAVTPSHGTSSIATADFNKDGKPDLVIGNSDTNYVSILLGNGLGSFSNNGDLPVGKYLSSWPQSVICTDMNADGNIDIVSANGGDNTVTIVLGNGNGTLATGKNFNVTSSGTQNNYPQSVVATDFNKDGHLDLATANLYSGDVSILLNDGVTNFQAVAGFAVGHFPYALACADFDKDTLIDIAVANANSNEISILLNCPTGKSNTIIKIDTVYAGLTTLNQLNENIDVYPNPSDGNFKITTDNTAIGQEHYELTICNLHGEKVFYTSTLQLNNSTIDISDHSAGVYFLALKSDKNITVKKIIIEK